MDVLTKTNNQSQEANLQDLLADLWTKLNKSLDLIAHRGPDEKGVWISDHGVVGVSLINYYPE